LSEEDNTVKYDWTIQDTHMSKENLVKDLERLRKEIHQVAANNPETYLKLNGLIADLERQITDDSGKDNASLLDRVKNEITYFETAHPRATAILNDILVTLSNIGI